VQPPEAGAGALFEHALCGEVAAIGVNLLLYGAIGPFAAAVTDRFGARRTMTLALAATAAGLLPTPAMQTPWQLVLLWGVVVGLSTGFVGADLAAHIAARWFGARQGFVIGILTAANAAGQLAFLPTMAQLVTVAGWRVLSLVLAATVVAAVPLAVALMRDRPEELGLARYREERRTRTTAPPGGNPVAVALEALAAGVRSRDFWLIAGGYCVCGATTNGLIGTHLIAACVDHGLSAVSGAGLLAATGVFALLGGAISGWLSDRCDNRLLLFSYYALRGLALGYLPFAFDLPFYGLSAFSIVSRARLDRRRAADGTPLERRRRRPEDRHHGRLDHRDPPDRQRRGGLCRRPVAKRLRQLFRGPSSSPGCCCWRRR
jgi:MFS family permease